MIIFIPALGSLLFIIHLFKHSYRIKKLRSNYIENGLFSKKKINKLKDGETFINLINIAEVYLKKKKFAKAIQHFQEALEIKDEKDPYTIKKLIECFYHTQQYNKVIEYFNLSYISNANSETLFYYGIALEKQGKFDHAEHQLRKNNVKYTNYLQRLELSKFLLRVDKISEARSLLIEIIDEMENMMKSNLKKHREIYKEAKALFVTI